MADNTQLNSGVGGDYIRADDISGVKTQVIKHDIGPEGVENIGTAIQSTDNTTTTALGAGETYTGTGEQNYHDDVMVSCRADVAGTLYFDFSNDGTNWDTFPTSGFKVAANVHEFHNAVKGPRYFRVRFVNGSSAQSSFRLYTYYGTFRQPNAPLNQSIGLDSDAILTRPSDFADEVRIGRRAGVTGFTKFGYREGLTAANGEETIWATTGNFTPLTSASTFTIAYTNTTDGQSQNGALTLFIQYIDSDGNPASAVHTLGSSGSDVTSFSGLGINRVAVSSSGSTQTNGSAITITATTGGTTQAVVPAGQGVTQQAIYFVGSNADAVATFLYMNIAKATSGGSPIVTVKAYVFNRNVATRYEVFRTVIDTSTEQTVTINEPVGFNLSPSDILYWVADTNTNNATVALRFSLREYERT